MPSLNHSWKEHSLSPLDFPLLLLPSCWVTSGWPQASQECPRGGHFGRTLSWGLVGHICWFTVTSMSEWQLTLQCRHGSRENPCTRCPPPSSWCHVSSWITALSRPTVPGTEVCGGRGQLRFQMDGWADASLWEMLPVTGNCKWKIQFLKSKRRFSSVRNMLDA